MKPEHQEAKLSGFASRRARDWWKGHPWAVDSLIAGVYAVLAFVFVGQFAIFQSLGQPLLLLSAVIVPVGICVAVLYRRRWSIAASVLVLVLNTLSVLQGTGLYALAGAIVIFSLAVHRTLLAASLFCALFLGIFFIVAPLASDTVDSFDKYVFALTLGIGWLIGVATRSRRDYVASIIVRAEQMQAITKAQERARIAREMHDIISHTLTVVILLSDGAVASSDEEKAKVAMKGAANAARAAMSDLRYLLGALRDGEAVPLAPQPSASELPELIQQFADAGLPARLAITGSVDPDPAVSLAVHRVVQEGLTNAIRYGQYPSRAEVAVDYRLDGVDVVIENDGALPSQQSVGAGQGLLSLQERVETLGGHIRSQYVGGGVWRLQAWIPNGEEGGRE